MKVYVLICTSEFESFGDEVSCAVYSTKEAAEAQFQKEYNDTIEEFGARVIDDIDAYDPIYGDGYVADGNAIYESGNYCINHFRWDIIEKEVVD